MDLNSWIDRGADDCSSYFQKVVALGDWWLTVAHRDVEGKKFGVAGTDFGGRRPVRVFSSAPIAKVYDIFTAVTVDGICVVFKGFINKERTLENGFSSEIFKYFLFGFPPDWEEKAGRFYKGVCNAEDVSNSMPSSVKPWGGEELFPTPYKGEQGRERSLPLKTVSEDTFGNLSGSEDANCCSTLSPVVENDSSSEQKCPKTDVERKFLEVNKLKPSPCNSEDIMTEIEANNLQVERAEGSMISPNNKGSSKQTELQKSKTNESSVIISRLDDRVIESPAINKSETLNKESTRKKNRARSCPQSQARLAKSKKKWSVKHASSSLGTTAEKNATSGKQKFSSRSTKRRINFDFHGSAPRVKTDGKTAITSPESLKCKRSRAGRLLLSTLEFWRNQVPVYDADRKLIGIQEEVNASTPSSCPGIKRGTDSLTYSRGPKSQNKK